MSHHLSRKHKKRSNYRGCRSRKKSKTINTRIRVLNKIRKNRTIRRKSIKLRGKGIKNEKISFSKTKTKSLCSDLDYNSCSKVRHKNKKIRICKFNYKKQFCETI